MPDLPINTQLLAKCETAAYNAYHYHFAALPPTLQADGFPDKSKVHGVGLILERGEVGLLVYAWGREWCTCLLHLVEEAELYELAAVLNRAVKTCTSVWDNAGSVDPMDASMQLHPMAVAAHAN